MPTQRKKLYLVYGPDEYRVAEGAKALIDELVPPADRAFGLESFDGRQETVDDVAHVVRQTVEAVQTMGFLGAEKTVWVHDITFIAPDRRSKKDDEEGGGRKAAVEKLRDLLGEIPDGHTLVLSGTAIDSRYGGIVNDAQKMQKAGVAEVVKHELPSKWKLAEFASSMLMAEARKRGRPLEPDVCAAIVARAGTDTRQLMSELEKLLLYCDSAAPTVRDVAAVVSPTADVEAWDLLDAFGMRSLPTALPLLHRLLDAGVSEVMLVIQLEYRVNDLLLVRDSLDRKFASGGSFQWDASLPDDLAQAAEDLGERLKRSTSNAFTARKLVEQARQWTRLELRNARHILDRAHARMTSIAMPSELVLELAISESLQKRP